MRRLSTRARWVLWVLLAIGLLYYAATTHPAPAAPAGMPAQQVLQVVNDPTPPGPAWTPPIAVYTVTTPNHPGEPCRINPECTYQSADPSRIDVFLHPDNPDEGPTYGVDYCQQEMVEQAPGTTCTVRLDPNEVTVS